MLKHSIIKLRRGTAAEWSASQPQPGGEVLKLGEPGYEKDTGKLKIGDGVTPWNSLSYFGNGAIIDPEDIEDILGDGFLVAGTGININYNDLANSLTISTSGVSLQGHNHTSSDITNFASAVSGLLPITDIDGGSYIGISQSGTTFTVSATGLQPSGNYSVNGHNHVSTDITDSTSFGRNIFTSVSYAAQNKLGWQLIAGGMTAEAGGQYYAPPVPVIPAAALEITDPASASAGDFYTVIKYSGSAIIKVGGETYSGDGVIIHRIYSQSNILSPPAWITATLNSFHKHTSSDITDFNSSVSGLLPVKDIIAGSGIAVSSTSGVYTINADVSGVILETIQDNLGSGFLVAGTGVQLTYNDAANTLTLDNLHTQINELSLEPQGFVNRVDSVISFDDSSRTFTIAPTGSSYDIYIEGVKVTKTSGESIVIGSGTGLNYIHFDTSTGLLSNKTTGFNFDTDVPIAYIHWNSDINQSTFFGEERHGIRMDSSTHKWIHNTFGMQYIDGLSIGGYTLLGDGSSNSHAQIDISDGTLYQEDIIINITNGTGAGSFIQQLNPIAYIPVYYHLGSTGQWVRDAATTYPLKYNGTRALYNLYSGGTWTTPNVPNNRYFAMWIVGTNDINDPILAIMGQREDSSLQSAENNNNWNDINLTNIPTNELRPLYRLIFLTNDTFTNTPKSSLQSILDIRKSILTVTYGVSQNDHGNLFGLGDDDHYQYVHINETRSIDAVHTFTNGLISNDNITVSGINVSLDGHQHVSTDITDFNSSVSGLLPTIANSGNNRILTSDGTSTGIVAESGLVFDGEQLVIRPNISGSISGLSPLVIYNDVGYSGLTNQGPQIILNSYASGNNISTSSAGRLIFTKFRGTEQAPLPAQSGDCVFVIRGNTLDADNISTGNVRIRADVVSPPVSGSQPYDSNRLYFNTSDGQDTTNNILSLEDDGQVYTNGYLTIFNQSRHSLVTNSSQQQSLGIYSQPSADIGASGILYGSSINFSPVSPTGDYNIKYYSTLSNVFSEVRENVSNSGAIVGGQFAAWRNARGSNIPGWYDDNGSLTALYGLSSIYGHGMGQSGSLGPAPTGVTPYTENAYGISIGAQRGYGTINYAYDLYLAADNYQVGIINNHYGIYQATNNPNYFAGSISVDNGLSAPTPVYSLGTVSGNTAINYAIDRQIQTLTLNGTSVNFTEGTGWTTANRSVDVVLQITVTSTTTVAFDSGFVTDWYSSLPTFSAGTYLILLRSIGSTVVQGHYIGKKL
jgi:hypothetical protein